MSSNQMIFADTNDANLFLDREPLIQVLASMPSPALLVSASGWTLYANPPMQELAASSGEGEPTDQSAALRWPWLGPLPAEDSALTRKVTTTGGRALRVAYYPIHRGDSRLLAIICLDDVCEEETAWRIAQAKQSELILQKMINSSYDGIFITDAEGRTLKANDAFCRISGLSHDALMSKTVFQLVEEKLIPNSCVVEVLQSQRQVTALIRYYQGAEGVVTGTPIFDDEGRLVRVIANVRDVTELNRLKGELTRANALATTYRDQLRAAEIFVPTDQTMAGFRSGAMKAIYNLANRIAGRDTHVLITGESGVGKDVLANYIHEMSDRAGKGTLVKINCGAIPETLLESELFGYEAGAFTGAQKRGKLGLFELASKGTIFLDEIGDMPLALQVKLLNVLQEHRMYRVGGTRTVDIDVRVIAATNADLEAMVAQGRFRTDLYYRLNVLPIRIPALRERPEDVLPLVMHFLDEFNGKHGMSKSLAPETLESLLAYDWPGNVREVRNTLERLVVTAESQRIEIDYLPAKIQSFRLAQPIEDRGGWEPVVGQDLPLKDRLEQYERDVLAQSLRRHETLRESANALGIDISTLVRKKRKYEL